MYYGLDQVKLYHINMETPDLMYLKQCNDRVSTQIKIINNEGVEIRDYQLGIKLIHNVSRRNNIESWYTYLQITTPQEQDNIRPKSIVEFKKHLDSIQKQISYRYHIELDLTQVAFKNIELNCTFPLSRDYHEYSRVINFILDATSQAYRNKLVINDSVYAKNKSNQIKIYNKSKTNKEQTQLCRVEYTLLTSKKVTSVFGTNKVNEITDEMIRNYLCHQFNKNIAIKCSNKLKKQDILIRKTLKLYEKQGVKTASLVLNKLLATGNILDIVQLENAIKCIDSNNYCKTIRMLHNGLESNNGISIEALKGNLERLREIQESYLNCLNVLEK